MILNNGAVDGFLSFIGFIPDAGVGVAVLANGSYFDLPLAAAFTAVDHALELVPRDWVARVDAASSGGGPAICDGPGADLPEPHGSYVGHYEHPAYGVFTVSEVGGRVVAELRALGQAPLFLDDDGLIKMQGYPRGQCELQVTFGSDGLATHVAAPFEPMVDAVVFARSNSVVDRIPGPSSQKRKNFTAP